jgi:hypothetical protein
MGNDLMLKNIRFSDKYNFLSSNPDENLLPTLKLNYLPDTYENAKKKIELSRIR